MDRTLEQKKFEDAFEKRLGKSPSDFVRQKLQGGSAVNDIRYLYAIMAKEIARQNSCKVPDFKLYCPNEYFADEKISREKADLPMTSEKKSYCKLVRDKIPEIIQSEGKICDWEILSDERYLMYLDAKLNEKLAEYQETKSLEGLADLLEVMGAVVSARGWSWDQLTALRKKKKQKYGGFTKRILLKNVQE